MKVWLVIGPSGCGKSTLGAKLAERLGAPFVEADQLHPPANIAKMSAGVPLEDAERAPWLAAVARTIVETVKTSRQVVVACSALKRTYREALARDSGQALFFVQPTVSRAILAQRLTARIGHFMPASLMDSQLAAFEPLAPEEPGLILAEGLDVEHQVEACLQAASGTPST